MQEGQSAVKGKRKVDRKLTQVRGGRGDGMGSDSGLIVIQYVSEKSNRVLSEAARRLAL